MKDVFVRIRSAAEADIPRIGALLSQVLEVHAAGRPDLFRSGTRKYGDDEIGAILADPRTPVLVAEADGEVIGHAFCVLEDFADSPNRTPIRSLYLDDLCVDERFRGRGVGRRLCEEVFALARSLGCYNVTLNVWACDEGALSFYRAMGLKVFKYGMETVL